MESVSLHSEICSRCPLCPPSPLLRLIRTFGDDPDRPHQQLGVPWDPRKGIPGHKCAVDFKNRFVS